MTEIAAPRSGRRPRRLRLLAGLLFLVQLGAAYALPVADGRVELASALFRGHPHYETHSSPSCPRPHTLECGLCQLLRIPGQQLPTPVALPGAGCTRFEQPVFQLDPPPTLRGSTARARAPPRLS